MLEILPFFSCTTWKLLGSMKTSLLRAPLLNLMGSPESGLQYIRFTIIRNFIPKYISALLSGTTSFTT